MIRFSLYFLLSQLKQECCFKFVITIKKEKMLQNQLRNRWYLKDMFILVFFNQKWIIYDNKIIVDAWFEMNSDCRSICRVKKQFERIILIQKKELTEKRHQFYGIVIMQFKKGCNCFKTKKEGISVMKNFQQLIGVTIEALVISKNGLISRIMLFIDQTQKIKLYTMINQR